MRRDQFATCAAILAVVLAAGPARPQPPVGTAFRYQGQLKQDGVPVDGLADFDCSVWDAEFGGGELAGTTLIAVDVINGLFAIDVDFGPGLFDGSARWLDIQVAYPTGAVFIPMIGRQAITPVPYAMTALKTVGVDGYSLDAQDGNPADAVRVDYSGRVLMERGGLTVFDEAGQGISLTSDTFEFNEGSSEDPVYTYSSIDDTHEFYTNGNRRLVIDADGDVGIGVFNPTALLHLGGTPGVDGLMFPDGTLQTTAAGGGGGSLWTLDQPGRISYDGEVTIGTNNTTASLKVLTEEGPAITATVSGEVGDGIVVSTVGIGTIALSATASGEESQAIEATAANTDGIAVLATVRGTYGHAIQASSSGSNGVTILAAARTDTQVAIEANATGTATLNSDSLPNTAGKFYASGADGVGIFGRTDGSSSYGVHGKAEGSGARGVYGEATIASGTALYGFNSSSTGSAIAVRGHTSSSGGFSSYFTGGKNYFGGRVGIGQLNPAAKLHIGGNAGSDGIMFPDGTLQTTAAVGGGGGSLWTESGADIFYTAGRVGIGTSSPQGKLHLAGANANLLMFENGGSPFLALGDGTTTVGWLQWSSANDELDLYTYGHNYPIAIGPTDSGGIFVDTLANSGNVGIGNSAPSESLHVSGDSRFDGSIGIGISPGTFSPLQIATGTLVGMKASTSFTLGGAGVLGEATAPTGIGRGVYGTATSPDGVGVYGESAGKGVEGIGGTYGVRGEADGSVEFSFGVSGTASTDTGRGVTAWNSKNTGDPIAIWGGTAASDGFGGFFQGRGYFRDAVTIGGTSELANQLTVRDDPFHSFSILSSIGVRDHTALIENEHTPGILQTTGVLALRANWPIGGTVNYMTFYQRDPQSLSYEQVGNIHSDGSGGIVLESAGGDYAEWLPVVDREEKFEPGDVVGVVGGRITKNTEGAHHVMVISTAPIVLGNQPPDGGDEDDGYQKIAFMGQAPVKVRGPVAQGDFIISSGLLDGTGVGVSPEGITSEQFARVIGQAWESSDEPGVNRVLAVIGQLPPDPTVARMAGRIEELEDQAGRLRDEAASLTARLESLETIVGKLVGGGNGVE